MGRGIENRLRMWDKKKGGARKVFFLIPHADPRGGGEEETKKRVMTWNGAGEANTYVM